MAESIEESQMPPPESLFRRMDQITPHLYLSGCMAVNQQNLLFNGITLIINCGGSENYLGALNQYVQQWTLDGLADVIDAPIEQYFESVFQRIESHIEKNPKGACLIHCASGVSRAPALVLAYLMQKKKISLRVAYRDLRGFRSMVGPNIGFWKKLIAFEERLFHKSSVTIIGEDSMMGYAYPDCVPMIRRLVREASKAASDTSSSTSTSQHT